MTKGDLYRADTGEKIPSYGEGESARYRADLGFPDPIRLDLSHYSDRELRLELCRRQKDRVPDPDIEFGPMGAWRSFYGQLAFDDDMRYRGMRLPRSLCPGDMEFKSVASEKQAVRAAGGTYDWEALR